MILLMNVDKDNPSVAEGESVQIQGAGITGFELKGNTEQDTLTGKNLLKISGDTRTINGITFTQNSDGSISVSGTANDNATYISTTLQEIEPNQNYKLSGCPKDGSMSTYRLVLRVKNDATTNLTTVGDTGRSVNVSTPSTAKYIQGEIWVYSGQTINLVFKPMVRLSSITDDTYEPYCGGIPSPNPDYPQDVKVVTGDNTINIHGKNLFDKNNANNLLNNVSINPSTDVISDANGFYTLRIDCKPNTTYTISKVVSSRFIVAYSNNLTYTSGETLLGKVLNHFATNLTITTGENAKTLYVFYSKLSDETTYTLQEILDSIQIEEGSTATEYEPYQSQEYPINLGNIELCKIGTYQDYIYKENGKWYLNKQIGKDKLSSSNVVYHGVSNSIYQYELTPTSTPIQSQAIISSHFTHNTTTQWWTYDNNAVINTTGGSVHIYMTTSQYANITAFNQFTSSNNVYVYYALATPTNTEITDTELKEDLEAISNIALFEGVNNISMESSNLTSSFKVYYDTWYEFDKILRNGYNIREDRDRITQKFANGHRKQFVSDYVDCSITLNLDTIDKDTTQDYLQRLKSGAYKYYSIDGKEYRTAQFIIENKPELSVENSISNNVDVNEYQITLLKAGD